MAFHDILLLVIALCLFYTGWRYMAYQYKLQRTQQVRDAEINDIRPLKKDITDLKAENAKLNSFQNSHRDCVPKRQLELERITHHRVQGELTRALDGTDLKNMEYLYSNSQASNKEKAIKIAQLEKDLALEKKSKEEQYDDYTRGKFSLMEELETLKEEKLKRQEALNYPNVVTANKATALDSFVAGIHEIVEAGGPKAMAATAVMYHLLVNRGIDAGVLKVHVGKFAWHCLWAQDAFGVQGELKGGFRGTETSFFDGNPQWPVFLNERDNISYPCELEKVLLVANLEQYVSGTLTIRQAPYGQSYVAVIPSPGKPTALVSTTSINVGQPAPKPISLRPTTPTYLELKQSLAQPPPAQPPVPIVPVGGPTISQPDTPQPNPSVIIGARTTSEPAGQPAGSSVMIGRSVWSKDPQPSPPSVPMPSNEQIRCNPTQPTFTPANTNAGLAAGTSTHPSATTAGKAAAPASVFASVPVVKTTTSIFAVPDVPMANAPSKQPFSLFRTAVENAKSLANSNPPAPAGFAPASNTNPASTATPANNDQGFSIRGASAAHSGPVANDSVISGHNFTLTPPTSRPTWGPYAAQSTSGNRLQSNGTAPSNGTVPPSGTATASHSFTLTPPTSTPRWGPKAQASSSGTAWTGGSRSRGNERDNEDSRDML